MIPRIKAAILIVYGFSLVTLAYKGAVDIAQDWLGDWLNEEVLDAVAPQSTPDLGSAFPLGNVVRRKCRSGLGFDNATSGPDGPGPTEGSCGSWAGFSPAAYSRLV